MAVILPDAAGAVRCEFRGTINGLPYANIFHVAGNIGGYLQADMNSLATAMHNNYWNAFGALLPGDVTLATTTTIDLTSRTSKVGIHEEPHTGTATPGVPPPNSLAVCLSWHIEDRYRGGHPRMYIPARQMADVVGGRTMNTGVPQLYQAAADGFLTSCGAMTVAGQTWIPEAVRYFSNHQLLAVPLQRPIRGAKVGTRFDSQRRRMGKETGI